MYRRELKCLVDCGTTHTILRNRLLFTEINDYKSSMTTMIGSSNLIIGRGTANFLLPNGTKMTIIEALYAPKANRTLLSFKDIRSNGYHIETHCENGNEYMYITSNEYGRKRILEKLMCQNSGLYLTTIRVIESYYVINNGILNNDTYRLWHDRLGHPGRDMMIRVLKIHMDTHSFE